MKKMWIALVLGAGVYGLHAFAVQLSAQPEPVASGKRPLSAVEFAQLSRTDPGAVRKFLHSQRTAY